MKLRDRTRRRLLIRTEVLDDNAYENGDEKREQVNEIADETLRNL